MCVTVNDLEYVRRTLSLLPNELQLDTMLETIEAVDNENFECREEISAILDTTINDLESEIILVISRIRVKVWNIFLINSSLRLYQQLNVLYILLTFM